jgi:hypothetical protein
MPEFVWNYDTLKEEDEKLYVNEILNDAYKRNI